MGRLDNKVAIITGGCGGIGQAAAAKFVSEGARVMLVDLDRSVLEEGGDKTRQRCGELLCRGCNSD